MHSNHQVKSAGALRIRCAGTLKALKKHLVVSLYGNVVVVLQPVLISNTHVVLYYLYFEASSFKLRIRYYVKAIDVQELYSNIACFYLRRTRRTPFFVLDMGGYGKAERRPLSSNLVRIYGMTS